MTNEYKLTSPLSLGQVIGDTKRVVIACAKVADAEPGESYERWITICFTDKDPHPYVVWDVVAKPNGWSTFNGRYYLTLDAALGEYNQKGGRSAY